jgi:hypothetical protein
MMSCHYSGTSPDLTSVGQLLGDFEVAITGGFWVAAGVETTDAEKREHWVRPVKRADIEKSGMDPQTTVLRFDNKGWNQHCGCARNICGHTGGHSF